MKRIVLTGGGTAGHVTPNLGLIPRLRAAGYDIHYIGTRNGIEYDLLKDVEGVTYHIISAGKLRRYADLKNLSDPFRVIKGIFQATRILHRLKPNVVFAKGGFVSVPVVVGARLNGVPAVLHESDMTPGLANKLCIPFSRKVLTSFPETVSMLKGKGQYVGAPVRESLFEGTREKGLQVCGFSGEHPILLSVGGSQGAQAINEALRAALPGLTAQFDVIHLCGKGNRIESENPAYFQMEYASTEMADLIAAADVVVSRAGSNAIFEFLALKKPALLIPLPLAASRGDQLANAKSFAAQGFAAVLPQEELTPDTLADRAAKLYENREACLAAMQSVSAGNGLNGIYDAITAY